jgi:peptidoglycan-N-acetylglucosamine deacetylase
MLFLAALALAPLQSQIAPNKLSSKEALARVKAETDPYWRLAQEELYEKPSKMLAGHIEEISSGKRLRKIVHGNLASKEITLTFDDGPHDEYTLKLLDILKRERVPATFFVIGMLAERKPDLIRAIAAGGHTIGNHTYHHVSLPKIPLRFVDDEILACGEVVRSITGQDPIFFRPPGGQYTPNIAKAAANFGYTTVLWTADPGDYANPGSEVILRRTLDTTSNGGIILLHDGAAQTITILPTLIRSLKAKGYKFVPLARLVENARKAGQPLDRLPKGGANVRRGKS